MSEDKFDEFTGLSEEELSIDELIEETKQEIGEDPLQEDFTERLAEYAAEDIEPAELPQEDFVPDFGNAFDDYGNFEEEEAEPEEFEKPNRRRKKRIVPLFVKILVYLVVVALFAVGVGYGVWECAQDVLALGRSDETVEVVIEEGDTLDDIAQMLKEKGIIEHPFLFKFYCKFTHSTDRMDPGTYELAYNYDYHAVVNGMVESSANRTTVRVMIPEGSTCAQIFELMEKNSVCTAKELEECAANTEFDYWFLEGIDYGQANRLEGFLFPDTYDFYVSDDPERVLDKLLTNFNRKFSEDAKEQLAVLNTVLAERLSDSGYDEDYIAAHRLGVFELITVASMIEKETAGASESGTISSVIYNRLCKPGENPYLNIDATVVYALGGVEGALTYEDTQVDSPYNTYRRAGLPIGPISNPGLSSITAALNPTDTNYYYYALDRSTGMHHFSEDYDAHTRFLEEQQNEE